MGCSSWGVVHYSTSLAKRCAGRNKTANKSCLRDRAGIPDLKTDCKLSHKLSNYNSLCKFMCYVSQSAGLEAHKSASGLLGIRVVLLGDGQGCCLNRLVSSLGCLGPRDKFGSPTAFIRLRVSCCFGSVSPIPHLGRDI